jgi:Prokaryotic N-terminal methylation motif
VMSTVRPFVNTGNARSAAQRGVSLVEAIVAMAVMAFGMMAIVGLQSTLRMNSDVAKQRSEAVRIAQEAIEEWRGFSLIEDGDGVRKGYDDLAVGTLDAVAVLGTNANYTLKQTVTDPGLGWKSLRVTVECAGYSQSIALDSLISRADPALSGVLSVQPADVPVRQPLGRHLGIPPVAKDLGNGKSAYKPPAESGTVAWVFDNLTGVIVGVCNTVTTGQAELTGADVSSCSNNANGLPLSGYVRFATDTTQPSAVDAEFPTSRARNLAVLLTLTSTGHPSPDHVCYTNAPTASSSTRLSVRYHCAIFFNANTVPLWSGISMLSPRAFLDPADDVAWTLAVDATDATATRYRVCRYTPASSDTQVIPNQLHPRNYSNVTLLETLTNQNFLVIRAGNGSDAFTCPTDVPAVPATGDFVNSNTLPHQPAPATP